MWFFEVLCFASIDLDFDTKRQTKADTECSLGS